MSEQVKKEISNELPSVVGQWATPARVLLIAADPAGHPPLPLAEIDTTIVRFEWEVGAGSEPVLSRLAQDEIDVILLSLSGRDSFDTFSQVYDRAGDVPIVVLTSTQNKDLALRVVEHGAHNYLFREQLDSHLLSYAMSCAARFKRIQQELNKSTQELTMNEFHLRNIINKNADGMIIVDRNGLISFANPAAETLFERSAENLIGAPLGYPLVAGEATEIDIIRRPGQTIMAEMRVVQTLWQGKPAYLASLRDITERKQAEKMLYRYAHELEKHNEELEAFAHTVAHDLQAPLGTIIGFANALADYHQSLGEKELREYLLAMNRSAHLMSNIIEELLVLAGVRKLEVKLRTLNMAEIVTRVQERLADMIGQNNAEIILPSTWPDALGYSPWVEEIWVNYISNAIKYGGQPPRIELGGAGGTEDTVRYWVKDNGIGVKLKDQDRLFTPFTQLNQARATGHGLGLSIVKRIVEKLGGQAWVESEGVPGQGSMFCFTLPSPHR